MSTSGQCDASITRRSRVLIPARTNFFLIFFLLFFKYIESILVSNIAPLPSHFLNFLNIVQYLYVHCTRPSILGSHPSYTTSPPTHNIATNQTPPPRPTPTPRAPPPPPPSPAGPDPPDLFCIFTITSILHSHPP